MAKLDIDFILIDESVVMNGFRALMNGSKLEAFKKNPVMLFMHNRAQAGFNALEDDAVLPIGKWYDIRVQGNQLLAKPDFDDDDDFALKIQNKVEKGYLNAASIWINPIATSEDESLALAGQRGPTITEWGVLEASIVDIPNCQNALAIRNSAGKKIALSGNTGDDTDVINFLKTLSTDKNKNMDRKLLCAKLGLEENATDAQISDALVAMKLAATNGTQLSAENKTLKDELIKLKADQEKAKIESLVDTAIKDTKLTADVRDKYIKLATADFDTTKELIDGMKPYQSIEQKLNAGSDNKEEVEGLLKLSGHELYMTGKLERLRDLNPDQFKLKYKEAFGVELPEAGK